jgi:protoporphyrin/coproporphyrin ferrochelatase
VKSGVLLLAHGAPERIEDVPQYLTYVLGGRPVPPRVVEEVRSRYEAIGGSSPLTHWTRVQAEALEEILGIPVFYGMRNWPPFIQGAVDQARRQCITHLSCVCLAPQYSEMSVGLYRKHTEAAADGKIELNWATSYHDEPLLIEAFAERLEGTAAPVLFTAHSLPAPNEQYENEARTTARLVAERAGVREWDFAFQSQGMSGGQWLGPTVESVIDRHTGPELVLQPIGFVCDHVEILYDIDIHFRDYSAARGITLKRPESLNGSPTFTKALMQVTQAFWPARNQGHPTP